ncbi:MAG: MFS transporter [Anaerolineaceae bacterium]
MQRPGIKQRITGTINEYPRTFWVLVIISFIDQLGNALIFPFFSLYLTKKFNASLTEVGLLFTFFTISGFIGSTVGGAMTDRIGRKGIMIFSLIASAFSNLAMGLSPSLYFCYGLALVTGIFTSTGGPASQAMIADLLPEEKRAGGFGILRIGFNVAVALGPAIGGLLASRSYLTLFIIDSVISSICAGLVYRFLKETKPESKPSEKVESFGATFVGYLVVLKDKAYMVFLAAGFLSWLTYQNMTTTLGVFLRDVKGLPESGYGLIISLNAVMVILFQFPITRRIEKFKPMLMMAIGTALYAVGYLLYGFISTFLLFATAMVVITIGEMIVAPVGQALSTSFAPEQMRGRYLAVQGQTIGIAYGIGPLLAGRIFDSGSPNWLWYAAGIVGMISALMFLLMARKSAVTMKASVQQSA